MKKVVFGILCTLLIIVLYPRVFSFVYRYLPFEWWTEKIAYSQVRDIYHPQNEDYQAIQAFLSKGKRPDLARLQKSQKQMRDFCLIGKSAHEIPQEGIIAVNCGENEKTNCLLVYASFNKTYPQALKKLVDFVKKSDFKGHILYRLGGWPNVEEGDLKLAHIPFAFKPCFFREAQRLGYQRVLWLDPLMMPLVSLNRVFKELELKGYFALENGPTVGPDMNERSAAALKTTLAECAKIPSCSAEIFGVDFSNEKASHVVSTWYQSAHHPDAFFSSKADQNTLSVILYQHGLLQWHPASTLRNKHEPISENTLFQMVRGVVQYGK